MPCCVATGSRLEYGCSASLSESMILRRRCGVDAATDSSGGCVGDVNLRMSDCPDGLSGVRGVFGGILLRDNNTNMRY